MLHGLMGSAAMLAQSPLARDLAAAGHRVIMPDLRAHGDSARPHAADACPPDVLADDVLALESHLGLDDYDLGGYSLGGRVALRALVRGARPARAFIAGQGLDALDAATSRTGGYLRALDAMASGEELAPGSPEAQFAR